MYRSLNIDHIISTTNRIEKRVSERFPASGLSKVCAELRCVVSEAEVHCQLLNRPNWWVRGVAGFLVAFIISMLVTSLMAVEWTNEIFQVGQFFEATEALVSEVVVIGAGIFFLITLEGRLKRKKALAQLHEFRALAHVIDMHQLTKDPDRLTRVERRNTESSPPTVMDSFALERYLDYCSEMLSIVGKTAALYAQNLNDPVVLSAVNEIEQLTAMLSNKVWQKITNIAIHPKTRRGRKEALQASAQEV